MTINIAGYTVSITIKKSQPCKNEKIVINQAQRDAMVKQILESFSPEFYQKLEYAKSIRSK